MEMRYADDRDTDKIKELWSYSFETYEPYFSWYFKTIYKPERTLCCFEGQELISSLQLAPYNISLRGNILPINYIVGVITSPQARGKGIAGSLINQAFTDLKKNGEPLAVLKPVCPSFYASLGFVFTYEELIWRMETSRLKELAKPPAGGRWYKYSGTADIEELNRVYQKMTRLRNGYIIRTKENWQNFLDEHLGENFRLWIHKTENEPGAYLLFEIKDRKLTVREIGYSSHPSLLNAFHFCYHHQNEADIFEWHGEKSNSCYQDFSHTDGLVLHPSIMARIVDLQSLLKNNIYTGKEDFRLSLHIRDNNLRWNNGTFSVVRAKGQLSVEEQTGEEKAGLATDIKSLTALIWGSVSVNQLLMEEKISGDTETLDLLARLLPPCDTFMNEYS